MGYFAGTSWIYVSDPERWRVDFKAYEFIAYSPAPPCTSCAPTWRRG